MVDVFYLGFGVYVLFNVGKFNVRGVVKFFFIGDGFLFIGYLVGDFFFIKVLCFWGVSGVRVKVFVVNGGC